MAFNFAAQIAMSTRCERNPLTDRPGRGPRTRGHHPFRIIRPLLKPLRCICSCFVR